MQHTFFVHFFAVVLHDYSAKLPETFLWRKCRTCSRSLFFFLLALNFSLHLWPLAFFILSPPLQNFAIPFELPYLLIELFYIGMPVVRTDGRAYCHVITKFSRMGRFFVPMGLRSSLRARAPLKSRNYRKSGILDNRVIYL